MAQNQFSCWLKGISALGAVDTLVLSEEGK